MISDQRHIYASYWTARAVCIFSPPLSPTLSSSNNSPQLGETLPLKPASSAYLTFESIKVAIKPCQFTLKNSLIVHPQLLFGLFPTFSTDSVNLPEKKFGYHHLAQLRYFFPKAFNMKTIVVQDEKKHRPELGLQVTFPLDLLARLPGLSIVPPVCYLNEEFYERLLDFVKNTQRVMTFQEQCSQSHSIKQGQACMQMLLFCSKLAIHPSL